MTSKRFLQKIKLQSIGALLALLLAGSAEATTYWVDDTGGSDGNACSSVDGDTDPGTYRATINGGAACLSTGDTLIVKPGKTRSYTLDGVKVFPAQPESADAVSKAPNFNKPPFATKPFTLDPKAYLSKKLQPPEPADGEMLGDARRRASIAAEAEARPAALLAREAERAAAGGAQGAAHRDQREAERGRADETHPRVDDPGREQAEAGEQRAPKGIAQHPSVLEPPDGGALAGRERGGTVLNGARVEPADQLQRQAANHGQHQAQRRAQSQRELPGRTRRESGRDDGRGAVIGIADRADGKDVEGEQLEQKADPEAGIEVAAHPARDRPRDEGPGDHRLGHAHEVEGHQGPPPHQQQPRDEGQLAHASARSATGGVVGKSCALISAPDDSSAVSRRISSSVR